MDKMLVYNKLPVFLQNVACYYEGWRIQQIRYGDVFWRLLKEYEDRYNWSYDQLCEFRNTRLKRMVQHCYKSVPYYTHLFNEYGINYESINTIEDLKVLPILTKQIVNENFSEFISNSIPRSKMVVSHTSGTTGSGFKFFTTNEAISEQWAVWWRYRRKIGIQFGMWSALFGGRSVVPINHLVPPYSRMNTPCKQEYFSTYHMSDDTLLWYINELEKKQLQWIHGYPSAVNLLAEYMLSHNIKLSYQLKYITVGAENLLSSQMERINQAFGIFPYQHYGLSEGVANFSQDPNRIMYVDEDFGSVEFLNEQGNEEACNVVGTTLSNYAMPLLRYRTGDIASVKTTSNGRIIMALDGRNEDYVILPNGNKIGRLDHIFKDMVNIKEAQIVQKKYNEIILKIVKGENYTEKDERMLYSEVAQRLSGINIVIDYIDRVQRSKNGKLRFVLSELPK